MTDRRAERIESLRRLLAARGLDGLLVSSLPNIRYLTGFSGSSALVLVTQGTVLFLSDFRYQAQATAEVGSLARLSIENGGLWERALKLLGQLPGVASVGFESHVVTVRDGGRLTAPGLPWRFQPEADIVEGLREVKAKEEVEAVRAAGAVATAALADTVAQVRPGQTENEVAAMLETALRRHGSEAFPFPTIVASGPRSALPHARTSEKVVSPGDLLLMDFGAVVGGYCSDVTRTFVVGAAPTDRQAELHNLVRRAQACAVANLRAGLTGRQADSLARDVIDAAGQGEAFGHSLGHGLGLEVHEAPRLARTAEQPLLSGAVVTVEPGVYLEGWGGMRIEDDVVLGPEGAELLTDFPRELVRLGD